MTFAQIRNYIKGLFDPILDSLKHDIDDAKVTSIGINEFNNLPQSVKDNGKAYFIPDVNFDNNRLTQTGFTPIGTIISIMGNHAPAHYLICDGTVYNISQYPELAKYFQQEFGSSNYFGGDGTTTFAVPDLRGEFLRGTGTNSHTNCGSGANVGSHQDATFLHTGWVNNKAGGFSNSSVASSTWKALLESQNIDSLKSIGRKTIASTTYLAQQSNTGDVMDFISFRPTNTSVLYCIAVCNICVDAKCNYSTTETVIGTWIDGKPLYQKTIVIQNAQANKDVYIDLYCDYFQIVIITRDQGDEYMSMPWILNQSFSMSCIKSSHQVYYRSTHSGNYIVTVQYTKTTD